MLHRLNRLFSQRAASCEAAGPQDRASRKTLNRSVGDRGEEAAAKHLQKLGYRILERQHRCPAGEVDIIAEHNGTIAFVEVKTRSPRALLPAQDAVDTEKQRRIRNSASHYLAAFREPSPHRFDIVAVYLDENDHVKTIEVFIEAFN